MYFICLTFLAIFSGCGPSKEELIEEVLKSPEFAAAVQKAIPPKPEKKEKEDEVSSTKDKEQVSPEEVKALKEMARCFTKIPSFSGMLDSTRARRLRRCGKIGFGEK